MHIKSDGHRKNSDCQLKWKINLRCLEESLLDLGGDIWDCNLKWKMFTIKLVWRKLSPTHYVAFKKTIYLYL